MPAALPDLNRPFPIFGALHVILTPLLYGAYSVGRCYHGDPGTFLRDHYASHLLTRGEVDDVKAVKIGG